jgi:hypothetical protein
MADLGSIGYTDVNAGTRVVDRTQEVRALAQGLDVAKTVVDEGIKAKVTGEMVESINNIEQQEAPAQMQGPLDEETAVLNRVDALKLQIKNGKVSQVTLATNQLKQTLVDAQEKYPWLRDELQRRASSVLSSSARLAQLGLEDQIATAEGTAAQKELQDLVDYARKPWPEGLGIDHALSPTDPDFAKKYVQLQEDRNMYELTQRQASMALARAQLKINTPEIQAEFYELVRGGHNIVSKGLDEVLKKYDFEKFMAEANLGADGDLQFVDDWKEANALAAKRDILQARADMEQAFNMLDLKHGGVTETHMGGKLQAAMQSSMDTMDRWAGLVQGIIDGSPTAVEEIARSRAILENTAFRALPDADQVALSFFSGKIGSMMLETAAVLKNASGINLLNRVSIASQTLMAERFPHLFDTAAPNYSVTQDAAYFKSTGALQIPPGAPAALIQNKIRAQLQNPDASFVVPTNNEEEQLIASLHGKDLHLRLLQTAVGTVADADPDFANNGLLGLTYSLSAMNVLPNPPNVQEELLEDLSSGALDRAVNVSLTGGPSGQRQAFAKEADLFYRNTRPFEARQEMDTHFHTKKIGGQPLSLLVKIDANQLDKGEFKWIIEKEALKAATTLQMQMDRGSTSTGAAGRDRALVQREVEQEIMEEMAKIQNVMNRQIGIEMLLNKARANNPASFQQANDWTDFFLGIGAPEGAESSWSTIFDGSYTVDSSFSRDR